MIQEFRISEADFERLAQLTSDLIDRELAPYRVLIEQVIHQNDILIENISEMRDLVREIPSIKAKLLEHDKRFDTIERVVRHQSIA